MTDFDARAAAIQRASLSVWTRFLGASAHSSSLYESGSLSASVVPVAPYPITNMVTYTLPDDLGGSLASLREVYASATVPQWECWVPESDAQAGRALAAANYTRAERLPAMLLTLADTDELSGPDIASHSTASSLAQLGSVNEVSHGPYPGLSRAFAVSPPLISFRIYRAFVGTDCASVLCTVDHDVPGHGVDCTMGWAATVPEFRRRGLASGVMTAALRDARARGCVTASGQASRMGAPTWHSLGYRTAFYFDLWTPPVAVVTSHGAY